MIPLSVSSMGKCIIAAYHGYVTGQTGTTTVTGLSEGPVIVNAMIFPDLQNQSHRYNCGVSDGVSGFGLNAADKENLRQWCTTQPGEPTGNGTQWIFGFRDVDPIHPAGINITMIDRVPNVMFNFHVKLI